MFDGAVIFLGGGVGAVCRYGLSGAVHRLLGSSFPYGTFLVNVLGSLCIGFLMIAFEERFVANPVFRLFVVVGILGGFTTFSAFSYETMALLRDGEWLFGTLNVVGNVVFCLSATYVGMVIGKAL